MPQSELRYIKGIGEKRAEAYLRLGIDSPDALLRYFPKNYINPGKIKKISELDNGEIASVKVTVSKASLQKKIAGGLKIVRFSAFDETGIISVVYFNNPYTPEKLLHGGEYILYGRIQKNLFGAEITNPTPYSKDLACKALPLYRGLPNLPSSVIAKNIDYLLKTREIADPVPEWILDEADLIPLKDAINGIHNPESDEDLGNARNRLIFDELFYFQLGLFRIKHISKEKTNIKLSPSVSVEEFYNSLPFEPTASQKTAVSEAITSMQSGVLMNRLLQGDVGSGKTMVAAALMFACFKSSYQSAIMAPTEILARQHYNTLRGFLEPFGINIVLLTGSMTAKEKREAKALISSGEASVLVGTHAVIEKDVAFKSLGLVITDEQHRFGVRQRSRLSDKGEGVHCLVMSATPIPRTLALVIYSDLEISVLSEIPKGRQPIETYRIDSSIRTRALGFIRDHCLKGRNAYIVCPLIETGENEDLISIEEYVKMLENSPVKDIPKAVLHGKMKQKEKDRVMADFLSGKIKLLISTTVVEVGVDVPNANIMMIENAERFGLSALHQLRGRVGRGRHKSYCILVSDSKGEVARERLGAIENTSDGFKIAEYDLKTRGPGDFFGDMQHGLPSFKIADLAGDMRIVKKAQELALKVSKADSGLTLPEHALLREEINNLFRGKVDNIYL